jgi:tetratricopeptide (TPR) repeat protein
MATAQELTNQAFELFAKGKIDEAIAILEEAIARDPNYIEAHRNIAMVYGRKGMLEEAVTAARRVVELDPDDHLGYVSLSIFLQRQGKVPEAEEAMAKGMAAQLKRKGD